MGFAAARRKGRSVWTDPCPLPSHSASIIQATRGVLSMSQLVSAILVAVGLLIVGLVLGVAGIFLFPIVGAIALVALVVWLLRRRAQNRPPIE
jgi:hypothetical protein